MVGMFKRSFSLLKNPVRLLAIASILPILCLTLYFSLVSLNHIVSFNGYAANGAFQLMNPLTRLAEGQVIGRDFPFFHGVGVALVHYPLFALFGEGLFGSEMSRWFTSVLLFIVSGLFFFYIWFYRQKDRAWLSLIAFAITFTLTAVFAEVITPSNSLLGIRTVMPVLIALLILNREPLHKKVSLFGGFGVNRFKIFIGFALAIAVLMGTEHGIAATIAYLLIELGISVSAQANIKRKMQRLWTASVDWMKETIPTIMYTATSLLVLSSVISHGHPFKLLRYSLITVPGDQFWYFGTEPQGYLRLDTLFLQLAHPSIYPLYIGIIITVSLIWLAVKLRILARREWLAIIFILSYGVLTLGSLLGYFFPLAQIPGILRVFILSDTLIITLLAARLIGSLSIYRALVTLGAGLLLFLTIATVSLYHSAQFAVRPLLSSAYHSFKGDQVQITGPSWRDRTTKFQPYIDAAIEINPRHPLWSTYASLYERNNQLIHPSSDGCDYIIHCLGDYMRDRYTQDFIESQPELVATLRPSYFGYEEWLWGRHASFYEHLSQNYFIVADNEAHILWKRTENSAQPAPPKSLIPSNGTIALPTSDEAGTRLIKVTVTYETNELYKKIPFANKLPRHMVRPYGTTSTIGFSMPPEREEWSFLVVLQASQKHGAYLRYGTDGLVPPVPLDISTATYEPIYVNDRTEAYFTEKSIFLR